MVLSKYVGETEKEFRRVFLAAARRAPSIVFLDELECLCEGREQGGTLITELLELMGECGQQGVWVNGATNRPHIVDEVRELLSITVSVLTLHKSLNVYATDIIN